MATPRLQEPSSLLSRLETFIDQPTASEKDFNGLARDVFAFQFERVEPFRRLAQARGMAPDRLDDWRQIPPVPVAAFKSMMLAAAPAQEIFRSSGTTAGADRRSVHHHPFPDLYRRVVERLFPIFESRGRRENPRRLPFLSLVAPRDVIPDSSLGFMVDHLLRSFGDAESASAMGAERLDFEAAARWTKRLRRRPDADSVFPGVIFSTAFALAWWLDHLEERGVRLELPPGSILFETGGFKGRTRELKREELLERIQSRLGVGPSHIVREYGMSELTGHFYTEILRGGDGDVFTVPHFMRVQALDPESLRSVPPGEPGLLAILDLANAGSAMHVLSEDLGVVESGGFRLIGRASGAELRGCSLTVDEIRP